MHRSPKLDLDKRNQMPKDQWRASLLHADCMSVPSVDPRQLVAVPRAMPCQVVHEALPLGLPDRWILLSDVRARQCSTSFQASDLLPSLWLLQLLSHSSHCLFHRFRCSKHCNPAVILSPLCHFSSQAQQIDQHKARRRPTLFEDTGCVRC